mgnify:CR=1 FL=1
MFGGGSRGCGERRGRGRGWGRGEGWGRGKARRCVPPSESRGGRDSWRFPLCRRTGVMSPAGEALEGNCPFEGACKAKAALAAGAEDKRKAARALES